EDGIRDKLVTGVQTCALPICRIMLHPTIIAQRDWRRGRMGRSTSRTIPADGFIGLCIRGNKRRYLMPTNPLHALNAAGQSIWLRSEERRVGKEGRALWGE